MYDLLIRNGTVIDGSGTPMHRADIAVKEEKIVAIGDLKSETAERTINADGLYVTPGFIDVNNHSDTYWAMFRSPGLQGMLMQGVTTIIGGNSGASLAPLTDPSVIRSIQKWTDVEKINFNWLTMAEFLKEVEMKQLALNFATLVGHGTLRRGVMKAPTKQLAPGDLDAMEKLLKDALSQGAIGFSTGLKYTHARSAEKEELVALLSLVGKNNGVYATYMRDEGEYLLQAVEEAITTAQEAGIPLHISHLKAVGEKNWHLFEEALASIKTASLNGLDISFDVYPYTASGSVLYTFLPEWVTESGRQAMLYRLRDFKTRQAVIRDMKSSGYDFSQMTLSASTLNKVMTRTTIGTIAKAQGQSPEDTVIDVLLASAGRSIVSLEVSSPENVMKAVQHPFSIISSNGVGYDKEHMATGDLVHPRSFGTFPKVFAEYVRLRQAISWEEAIHKMTGKPAAKFFIQDRGLLREQYKADMVIFDPETVAPRSTMDNPYEYPEGIEFVVVNGTVAVEGGSWNGSRKGQVIRKKSKFRLW